MMLTWHRRPWAARTAVMVHAFIAAALAGAAPVTRPIADPPPYRLPDVPPAASGPDFVREVEFYFTDGSNDPRPKLMTRRYLADYSRAPDYIADVIQPVVDMYRAEGYVLATATVGRIGPERRLVVTIDKGKLTGPVEIFRLEDGQPTTQPVVRTRYLAERLTHAAAEPFNKHRFDDAVLKLQEDPNVLGFGATLHDHTEADDAGEGMLLGLGSAAVYVKEAPRYFASLSLDNHQNPSVGSERLEALLADTNLTGAGDVLVLRWGLVAGEFDDAEFAGTDDVGAGYERVVTPSGATVSVRYDRTNEPLVEPPLSELGVTSRSQLMSIGVAQPFWLRQHWELTLSVGFDLESNETELFGEPFPFSPDLGDGQSRASVLRFGQTFSFRKDDDRAEVFSRFSVGIGAFDATEQPGELPDGQFFSWQGGVSYARLVPKLGRSRLVARGFVQLTPDRLLALEKVSVGGHATVRGYRESLQFVENAMIGSVELQIPVPPFDQTLRAGDGVAGRPHLAIAPFFDIGQGWDRDQSDNPTLASVGVGLLCDLTDHISAQIYWGYALNEVDVSDKTLQDRGVHFRLVVRSR